MAISNPFAKRHDPTCLDWRVHGGVQELIAKRRQMQDQLRDLELATPTLELARITAEGDVVEAEGRRMLGHIGDDELAAAKDTHERAHVAVSANTVQIRDTKAALEHLLRVADPVYRGAIDDVRDNVTALHRDAVARVDRAYAELLDANTALRRLEHSVASQDGSIEREYGPTAARPRLHVPQSVIGNNAPLIDDRGYREWRRLRFKAGALIETKDDRLERERREQEGADRLRAEEQRRADDARRAREFNRD